MSERPAAFSCQIDGEQAELALDAEGLTVGDRRVAWEAIDTVSEQPPRLELGLAYGVVAERRPLTVSHLGARFDECTDALRTIRGAARRKALAQTGLSPVETFTGRRGGEVVDAVVLPHALVLEPRGGLASYLPWGLVQAVERDGWSLLLHTRGIEPVTTGGYGGRTDELEQTIGRVRRASALAARTEGSRLGAAGAALDDGWALAEEDAAEGWPSLRDAWLRKARGVEASLLVELADEVRFGVWTQAGTASLPFMLALVGAGEHARVAVEAVDADDRATFVFADDDLDRVNAGLLLTSFRRELLSLEDAELGAWATAVRTQPPVHDLRSRLTARIVHDGAWEKRLREALVQSER